MTLESLDASNHNNRPVLPFVCRSHFKLDSFSLRRQRVPDPGDVLAALREPSRRVQVRLPQGLPQRPARPYALQGVRGPRRAPLRPQDRHQEDRARQVGHQRPHHHRQRDEVELRRRLRLQDGHGLLVGCHDAEAIQVRRVMPCDVQGDHGGLRLDFVM